MNQSEMVNRLNKDFQDHYKTRNVIISFDTFLDLVERDPQKYIRNAAKYLLDAINHFGKRHIDGISGQPVERFSIFDAGSERSGPIIGGEAFQNDFINCLQDFHRQGFISKLILFHGPNGSAKSSTVETLSAALQNYSLADEGCIYRFNWVFPADKDATPRARGDMQPIGFGQARSEHLDSYALLDEHKVASKLTSEFKENPIFLVPMPYREQFLRESVARALKIPPDNVELPRHVLQSGLSKKNQVIFENLLNAYDGKLGKVFQHVQVERFFYSRQYRVGISTVEPQMSIDAMERQVTLDKNFANMPSILQTISFHQLGGELIEANRGLLEFSDLLKRPIESFKYLLSTIEKGTVNLPSGTALLDTVFVATTNEKHLDAFKTSPDFSSFKGRFELIKVPYLLLPSDEEKIYAADIDIIRKTKHVCPHSLQLLSTWAVMTRLKQPDPEVYPRKFSSLITKLDPRSKVRLYEKQALQPVFTNQEQLFLEEIRSEIWKESRNTAVYEGRFGASPREIRSLLHKAAHNPKYPDLTPMAIFDELGTLIKDKTVYDFLQFEPRARYHDVEFFIELLKHEFVDTFEHEVIQSMSMADEDEYDSLLAKYITHVVAAIKKERIWDEVTSSYYQPSQKIMDQVEDILEVTTSKEDHRAQMLSRIASYKLEHPRAEIKISIIFADYLTKVKQHFYKNRKQSIDRNFKVMLMLDSNEKEGASKEEIKLAGVTLANMESLKYNRRSVIDCLKFVMKFRQEKDKGSLF